MYLFFAHQLCYFDRAMKLCVFPFFFLTDLKLRKQKTTTDLGMTFCVCVCVCRFLMASQLCVCRRNILGFDNDTQLSSCRFDPNDPTNKLCPIFDLYKIVELAGVDSYETIASLVIIPQKITGGWLLSMRGPVAIRVVCGCDWLIICNNNVQCSNAIKLCPIIIMSLRHYIIKNNKIITFSTTTKRTRTSTLYIYMHTTTFKHSTPNHPQYNYMQSHTHTNVCALTNTHTHATQSCMHTHTSMHMYIHTHACTCTHKHTHTHTHYTLRASEGSNSSLSYQSYALQHHHHPALAPLICVSGEGITVEKHFDKWI